MGSCESCLDSGLGLQKGKVVKLVYLYPVVDRVDEFIDRVRCLLIKLHVYMHICLGVFGATTRLRTKRRTYT